MAALPPFILRPPGARGTTYEIHRLSRSNPRRPTYYRYAVLYGEQAALETFDLLTAAANG
jgi:hypothetical protein